VTDTSQFPLPLEHRFTQDMMYGLKPSALQSRSTRMRVAPLNGSTFTPGSQVIFEIPVGKGRNCFLDQTQCYLKFDVQCSSTAAANPDGSGVYVGNSVYSFIQQQYVYHGGQLLEFINQYGQLAIF
jgi:hypothetical protein